MNTDLAANMALTYGVLVGLQCILTLTVYMHIPTNMVNLVENIVTTQVVLLFSGTLLWFLYTIWA